MDTIVQQATAEKAVAFELRDYQKTLAQQACAILQQYKIVYLALQTRVGKSATSLHAAELYGAKKVLFITKLKAIKSIESDFEAMKANLELTVVNTEAVHKVEGEFDLIIVDEAHQLSSYPVVGERTRQVKKICQNLPIIYLSATPTPENFSQIYHQFYISSFSPFKDYTTFYKWAAAGFVHKKVKFFFNKQVNDYSHANKEKIDEYTKHLFLTFTQEQAGFTMFVQEKILHVEMQKSTYALADKLVKKRVHIGKDGQEIVADTEVSLMQKLHQIYSGTIILESGEAVCFDQTKAQYIRRVFTGKKIAIFYKFRAELGSIIWAFGAENITDNPQVFNESSHLTFACQVQSGREGVNLSTADCLVFLNICFSSVSYWQARARLQTQGRTKEAMLYWIFARGGIEDKIYKAVQQKKNYTTSYFKKDYGITDQQATR